jgi:hypothetical protein
MHMTIINFSGDEDAIKKLMEKLNQIPKDITENAERVDKTKDELINWLKNSGLNIYELLGILDIIKFELMAVQIKADQIMKKM